LKELNAKKNEKRFSELKEEEMRKLDDKKGRRFDTTKNYVKEPQKKKKKKIKFKQNMKPISDNFFFNKI